MVNQCIGLTAESDAGRLAEIRGFDVSETMKTRITLVLCCGVLGLITTLGAARSVSAATLEEELAGLVLDHPNIRAAYKTVESSRQGVKNAKSAYYPQISVSADVAHEVINSPSERQQGDGQEGKPSSRTPQSASISLSQNLFNGFATASAVRSARLNKELALMTLEGSRQPVIAVPRLGRSGVLRSRIVPFPKVRPGTSSSLLGNIRIVVTTP